MKTFSASDLGSHKRKEIFAWARREGVIIQRKETNGVVIEEFLLIANEPLVHSGHSIQMVKDMTEA